jgi:hypothetical protein
MPIRTSFGSPRYLKEQECLPRSVPGRPLSISAIHAAGILVKTSENRSEEEIQILKRLKTGHWVTKRCCTLFEQFAGMLRDSEQRSEEQITRNWKIGQSKPKHPGSPM